MNLTHIFPGKSYRENHLSMTTFRALDAYRLSEIISNTENIAGI